MLNVPLSKLNDAGAPVYSHGIEKLTDTAEVRALIRNALTQQPDQSCVVVLTGPATNLARTLDLPGVKELIARKARFPSVVGRLPRRPAAVQRQSRHRGGEESSSPNGPRPLSPAATRSERRCSIPRRALKMISHGRPLTQ